MAGDQLEDLERLGNVIANTLPLETSLGDEIGANVVVQTDMSTR